LANFANDVNHEKFAVNLESFPDFNVIKQAARLTACIVGGLQNKMMGTARRKSLILDPTVRNNYKLTS